MKIAAVTASAHRTTTNTHVTNDASTATPGKDCIEKNKKTMEKKIKIHRMDSCAYYRKYKNGIICMNPEQRLWMPICATKECKYFTPKEDGKEAGE